MSLPLSKLEPNERQEHYDRLEVHLKDALKVVAAVQRASTHAWAMDTMEGIWARHVLTSIEEALEDLERVKAWVGKVTKSFRPDGAKGARRGGSVPGRSLGKKSLRRKTPYVAPPPKVPDPRVEARNMAIKAAYEGGVKLVDIAKQVGLGKSQVGRVISRLCTPRGYLVRSKKA